MSCFAFTEREDCSPDSLEIVNFSSSVICKMSGAIRRDNGGEKVKLSECNEFDMLLEIVD